MLEALHLISVCFRDRRQGVRRIFQIAELIPSEEKKLKTNVLFRWKPAKDQIVKQSDSYRLMNELRMHTGMREKEIHDDIKEKEGVLDWLVKNKVNNVDAVGRVISEYYTNRENILEIVEKNQKPEKIISREILKD